MDPKNNSRLAVLVIEVLLTGIFLLNFNSNVISAEESFNDTDFFSSEVSGEFSTSNLGVKYDLAIENKFL